MKKQENKTSRANQTRSKTERPKVWVPPSSLDAPLLLMDSGTDGSELNRWDSTILRTYKLVYDLVMN